MNIFDFNGKDLTIKEFRSRTNGGDSLIKRILKNIEIRCSSNLLYYPNAIKEYKLEHKKGNIKPLSYVVFRNLNIESTNKLDETSTDLRLRDTTDSLEINVNLVHLLFYNRLEADYSVENSLKVVDSLKPYDKVNIIMAYIDKDTQRIREVLKVEDFK